MFVFGFGSRSFLPRAVVFDALDSLPSVSGVFVGDARGADSLVREWCRARGIFHRVFKAEWRRFGRSAGPRRTADLVHCLPDSGVVGVGFVVGVPCADLGCVMSELGERSRGSWHSVGMIQKRGFPVRLVWPTAYSFDY